MALPRPLTGCWQVQITLKGGCAGAWGLVLGHKAHTDLHKQWGEPSPVQWQRTPVPRAAKHLKPQLRRSLCSSSLGLLPGLGVHGRHGADTRAYWGSCGFHLTKMFPWRVSASHSCCRGLPPCQVQSSICLLRFQMLAARQAKGCTQLHLLPRSSQMNAVIPGGLFISFEGRGGREEAHYSLEMNMWPKWRCVQQLEAGDSPQGATSQQGGVIFICRQTALPWGQLCHHGNPVAPSCKGQGAALAFPPSLLPGVLREAMPPSHGCGQG